MKYIKHIATSQYCKDGSKFLAFIMPFNAFEAELKNLQETHKKAVHFVRASRAINEFQHIIEHSSDDGEPKGSSGVPVLNVLRGRELVNCGCVVVRYFGGKLLGIGGLVRAYSNATLLAIENAEENGYIVDFVALKSHKMQIAFNRINHIKYIASKINIHINNIAFLDNVAEISFECDDSTHKRFIEILQG